MGPGFGEHIARSMVALLIMCVLAAFTVGIGGTLFVQFAARHIHISASVRP